LIAGCGGGGGATADAAAPDAPPDAPRLSCATKADCPAEHFCGAGSKTCVSAVTQVVAGAYHSCALHRNGTVSCWGLAESISAGAGLILPPGEIGGLLGPLALSAGANITCALTSERRVRCWGNQSYMVVKEDGTTPVASVSNVAVGSGYGCATNPDGTYCWGKNEHGQLGRPVTLEESPRALLAAQGVRRFLGAGQAVVTHDGAERICAWGDNSSKVIAASDDVFVYTMPQCGTVKDVVDLQVGSDHACVRHSGGTFACWGERYYGQLGLGGTDTADVPPYGTDTSLPGGVASLALGTSHTCALLEDGKVVCFGLNSNGQVGPNPDTMAEEVRTPATVTGFSGRVVAIGAGSSAQHTCAILEAGSVECWGSDRAGQLGDAPTTLDIDRFSAQPVAVRW
jgi:alpha-tubulin suppressor-like RCC1 family protein